MSPDKLVRMANQIATFFEAQGSEGAAAEVEAHIRQFWDPRMREAILAYAANGGAGLDPVAAAAIAQLAKARLAADQPA